MQPPLKICFAVSEVAPLAKTGGLADVAGALPHQLQRLGHDVRVFMPFHSAIDTGDLEIHAVDFIRDVEVQLGPRSYAFTTKATKLPGTDFSVYLIDCPELFHRDSIYTSEADEPRRFALFSRAVIESCQRMGWAPDIFHCNDWHTALIPLLLRTVYDWDGLFRESKTLLTIHNIGYQGSYPAQVVDELGLRDWANLLDQDDLSRDVVNILRSGLIYADVISTVSPTYAAEIQTDEYGMGLQHLLRARSSTLIGILNGVDYAEWSPESDPWIPYRFSRKRLDGKTKNKAYLLNELELAPNGQGPLLGVVSRLTHQKGFDLGFEVLPQLLAGTDLRLVVLGAGEARYEQFFEWLQRGLPGKVCYHRGYNNELAHVLEAGSDMFLMPSRYEPCGLNQMFSLRYGTIPIVRRTGGLADSVKMFDENNDEGTGFLFDHFTPEGLRWALEYAIRTYRDRRVWRRLMRNAMKQDFSWENQSRRYVELYSWMARR